MFSQYLVTFVFCCSFFKVNSWDADSACTSIGGKCQYDGLYCSGQYLSGKCSGGTRNRCCVKDYACTSIGGKCQYDGLYCSGQYLSGKCSGGTRNRCCVSASTCSRIGGKCQYDGLYCSGPYLSGKCSGGTRNRCCVGGTAKNYACAILDLRKLRKVALWNRHASGVSDNAYAVTNVVDTCYGRQAARSKYTCKECRYPGAPGGRVWISSTVTKFIYNLANSGQYLHVNEIAGACHSCSSKHYRGLAVDIHNYGSRKTAYRNQCQRLGGWFLDEGSHYHCTDVRNADVVPLAVPFPYRLLF